MCLKLLSMARNTNKGNSKMTTTKIKKAVYVENAECHGSGSDQYKSVSGITKKIRAEVAELEKEHGKLTILVDSNTNYQGQQYKRVEIRNGYTNHRQIKYGEYVIVEII